MSCEEFRIAVWEEIDGGSTSTEPHCADCREYEKRARALHRALPEAFASRMPSSTAGAVLRRIREERRRTGLESYWLPAGAFTTAALCFGTWEYVGASALVPYLPLPDLSFLLDLSEWTAEAQRLAVSIPAAWLGPAAGLSALLWLSTHSRIVRRNGEVES